VAAAGAGISSAGAAQHQRGASRWTLGRAAAAS